PDAADGDLEAGEVRRAHRRNDKGAEASAKGRTEMSSRAWTVACLAGDGVGPELMAETSRVLTEVARLHAFHLDDVHLPFGGEALTRLGHPLPPSTREAYRRADAIFVSSPADPAFDGVKADLDLRWRVSRVHNGVRGDLVVVEPVGYGSDELTVARAFRLARAPHLRWLDAAMGRARRCGG